MNGCSSHDSCTRRQRNYETRNENEEQIRGREDIIHLYSAEKELKVKSQEVKTESIVLNIEMYDSKT